jgi:hypothetical protein
VARRVKQSVWLVVACGTFAAQVMPLAWSGDCDRDCRAAESHECCAACPAEPAAPPCHCRLDVRQDQPLSVPRDTSPGPDLLGQVGVGDRASLGTQPAIGVSREYVAASLAVPIRPVRILYGVWRD